MELSRVDAYLLICFNVYLNKLIENLRTSNIGCKYGNQYMGVFCAADDLSLLSPPFTGLQEMLRICELYVIDHNIIFNATKVSYGNSIPSHYSKLYSKLYSKSLFCRALTKRSISCFGNC